MIVKVKYFDIEKYEGDWKQYYKDEETIHSNRLISPTDKGFAPYLKDVEVAITGCDHLIARLGSVMVSSNQLKSRRLFIFTPILIITFTTGISRGYLFINCIFN
jgi:hypothetical protein